jgi:hypothetical protein
MCFFWLSISNFFEISMFCNGVIAFHSSIYQSLDQGFQLFLFL